MCNVGDLQAELSVIFKSQRIAISQERLSALTPHLKRATDAARLIDILDLNDSPPAVVFSPDQV